jgi:tetratricopeptide (TPR) repeat protein
VTALILLLLAVTAATRAGAAATAEDRARLRARATELFQRREQARLEGGVELAGLHRDLARLAEDLEAAGMDSLASTAHYRAAGVLHRLSRNAEAEQHLHRAVAAALRARATRQELAARVSLVMSAIERSPEQGIAASRALVPRLQRERMTAAVGDLRAGEARAYMELGRWREALASARRAADQYARAGNRRLRANALTQVSQSLRFLGRMPEALALTDSVIAIGRAQPVGGTLSRALLERSSLLAAMGRDEDALAAANEALADERRRGDRRGIRAARMFRANLLLERGRPRAALAEAETLRTEMVESESRAALVRVAGVRAGALRALGRAAEAERVLAEELDAFERWRAALSADEDRTAVAEHANAVYALWTRLLIEQGRDAEAWRAAERGRAAGLERRLRAPAVPDLAALCARLRRTRAALLHLSGLDAGTGSVLVLSGAGLTARARTRDVSGASIRAAVAALGSTRPVPRGALDSLSARLLGDAWPLLPQGLERLIVIAPAEAAALPFEALPVPGGMPLHRKLGPVSYVPSASVLAALDDRRPAGRGFTIVAAPEVDAASTTLASLPPATRGNAIRPLAGAREEAKHLAEPGATVLLGRDATLERLGRIAAPGVLHLATHAVEDPRLPARGGLVMAGAEPLLTSVHAESLALAADLVTLSGCGTLGSVRYAGEGAFGLARGFLVGGARSVVTTRWNVGDRAASRAMVHFYAGLRAGLARDVALMRASDTMRAEGFPPRDCNAFLLMGLPDAPVERWAAAGAGRSAGPAK